jgi:hypothetical protein
MGRGRAKAKQTKVARELKYNGGNPDLSALQAELGGSNYVPTDVDDDFEDDDPYAKYYEEDEEDDAQEAQGERD